VSFEAFEASVKFTAGRPDVHSEILLSDVIDGLRPFTTALLTDELRSLLGERLDPLTVELGSLAKFSIGYVTGDKTFFHPSPQEVTDFDLPASSLYPAATSARQLRGAGVFTAGLSDAKRSHLFLPARGPLTAQESRYVARGEEHAIDTRYKCRVRRPWWVVPGVLTPDLLVSVFSEEPGMLVNDAGLVASNSLLCGYLRDGASARSLVAAWYTPLSALQRELHVHSLGGGVFVLVPGEIARVRVPRLATPPDLRDLDRSVRTGDLTGAYAWGRDTVLRGALALTDGELDMIEDGRQTLARWRSPIPVRRAGVRVGP
jgi:hypothetical protein